MKKTTKITSEKPAKPSGPSLPVYGLDGSQSGTVAVPKELFGAKVNKPLLAQAVRVYLANQRSGSASTKTRGEVEGSTRKIYRQKGTGKARHGAIRAPIFVGGGIVFGPKPRSYHLDFPQKMRRAALVSALTAKYSDGDIFALDTTGMEPKTKIMAAFLKNRGIEKSTLIVVDQDADTVSRASRNIAQLDILPVSNLNAYHILAHTKIMFDTRSVKKLQSFSERKTV